MQYLNDCSTPLLKLKYIHNCQNFITFLISSHSLKVLLCCEKWTQHLRSCDCWCFLSLPVCYADVSSLSNRATSFQLFLTLSFQRRHLPKIFPAFRGCFEIFQGPCRRLTETLFLFMLITCNNFCVAQHFTPRKINKSNSTRRLVSPGKYVQNNLKNPKVIEKLLPVAALSASKYHLAHRHRLVSKTCFWKLELKPHKNCPFCILQKTFVPNFSIIVKNV